MSVLVIISLLVLKGYSGGAAVTATSPDEEHLADPVQKTRAVNQLVQDVASKQRQALEQQIEQ
jgi:hypothetical protein